MRRSIVDGHALDRPDLDMHNASARTDIGVRLHPHADTPRQYRDNAIRIGWGSAPTARLVSHVDRTTRALQAGAQRDRLHDLAAGDAITQRRGPPRAIASGKVVFYDTASRDGSRAPQTSAVDAIACRDAERDTR